MPSPLISQGKGRKSWKFEALRLERELEIKEKQIKELEDVIKNKSLPQSNENKTNNHSLPSSENSPIEQNTEAEKKPASVEPKTNNQQNPEDVTHESKSKGNGVADGEGGNQIVPTPTKQETTKEETPTTDLQLDDSNKEEKAKEDYKNQCGECGAYFDDFKNKTLCPNCDFDWSE